jgi:hypothetical protein
MIQMALQTTDGPIGIIGINEENLRRMQAGMSLDVDLTKITPPGTQILRVVIHYAHTYEDVLKDMREGGIEIPDALAEQAKALDATLQQEAEGE